MGNEYQPVRGKSMRTGTTMHARLRSALAHQSGEVHGRQVPKEITPEALAEYEGKILMQGQTEASTLNTETVLATIRTYRNFFHKGERM